MTDQIVYKNKKSFGKLGVYIHVPFCVEKCRYCDFLSFSCKNQQHIEEYIESLTKDILWSTNIDHNKIIVDTIFIGGGTPTILSSDNIEKIMSSVKTAFTLDEQAEISIESNPGTLDSTKLSDCLAMGINRLSIGAQSLNDRLLKRLGRIHNRQEFLETYKMARKAGFNNINIDLMFALPDQSFMDWKATVDEVLMLEPEHLSFYSLQLEEGTAFYKQFQDGNLFLVEDELDRKMYWYAATAFTKRGYNHYEISNCAKKGSECRHNLKYWSMDEYLGLGLGAHSYMGGYRISRKEDLDAYISVPQESRRESPLSFEGFRHRNTREDSVSEFIFTSMRKTAGISTAEFKAMFGEDIKKMFAREIEKHEKGGLVQFYEDEKQGEMMCLTRKGLDLANTVLSDFV